jgi:hypothetical protein
MNLPTRVLLALCIVALCAPGGASAQEDKWGKPIDLKQFVPPLPPVVPLPRNYELTPGTAGGAQGSNASGPFQNPASSSTQTAPGIRLTIPSR